MTANLFSTHGRYPSVEEAALMAEADRLHAAWLQLHGARPSRTQRCAHSLIKRRHPPDMWRVDADCLPPGWDHAEMWNLPDRRRVLVYHPYRRPDRQELVIFDAWWRTTTRIFDPTESWYYPGQTWRVEVWSQ